jgi:GTP diphosphokinase / guanosine-3',5'-bis(diphosphate) 3'-diphosphatase
VVSYGRCCHPIPGDQVVGVLSKGRGIVVHREGCRNLNQARTQTDKHIDVQWSSDAVGEFTCEIRLDVSNKPGVLARTATVLSDEGANIQNVELEDRDGINMSIVYLIDVKDRVHLANIMRRLRKVPNVLRIARV